MIFVRHEAWQEGAIARARDRQPVVNPYKRGDIRRKAWKQGHDAIDKAIWDKLDMAKY
jgi:hypothetical protein